MVPPIVLDQQKNIGRMARGAKGLFLLVAREDHAWMACRVFVWMWVAFFLTSSCRALAREERPLDLDWRFQVDAAAGAQAGDFDDSAWQAVDLPHDWSIVGEYKQHAAVGGTGAYRPFGIGWYRHVTRRVHTARCGLTVTNWGAGRMGLSALVMT
jgi:hypothetical protein